MGFVYAHRVELLKSQGAPIDWVSTMNPIVSTLGPVGLAARSQHPNAGKLLIDFLLSADAQKKLQRMYRIPSRSNLEPISPSIRRYPFEGYVFTSVIGRAGGKLEKVFQVGFSTPWLKKRIERRMSLKKRDTAQASTVMKNTKFICGPEPDSHKAETSRQPTMFCTTIGMR